MKLKEYQKFLIILIVFLGAYFIPFDNIKVQKAIMEMFYMLSDYAHHHVLLCLVPAFFIAGAIAVFISKDTVLKYLGPTANKLIAYSTASVSGSILAVCSCTVLPLFAGIYRMGAGLGPATAFLYSGPAINILAIVLTAKVLGWKIGLARAVGAVAFAFIVGLLMAFTFRKEELQKQNNAMFNTEIKTKRNLLQESIYFFSMVGILVFANWGKTSSDSVFFILYKYKWYLTGFSGLIFAFSLIKYFEAKTKYVITSVILTLISAVIFAQYPLIPFSVGVIGLIITGIKSTQETRQWMDSTWDFAKQILPLLFIGILIAGFLLGMPASNNGIIPKHWITEYVGSNSLFANFFASIIGAFMYFATLTEVPILQGLLGAGMHKGPALALLLAGPALSLPNMLVIRSVLGTKKTVAFVAYVVILSTIVGKIFGIIA